MQFKWFSLLAVAVMVGMTAAAPAPLVERAEGLADVARRCGAGLLRGPRQLAILNDSPVTQPEIIPDLVPPGNRKRRPPGKSWFRERHKLCLTGWRGSSWGTHPSSNLLSSLVLTLLPVRRSPEYCTQECDPYPLSGHPAIPTQHVRLVTTGYPLTLVGL
ncbi:hypothetical protein CERSUDRAFT_70088 [Gelatoporia subvermispora B]|uniref:Uncharacterized protein n=1 Tax=Ceriporiopsis subvermispora (strain B) TaxID=914234 RepID=M2RSY7_CERS8|nr:hypothetical protein CERSUDRAFT_70088 [Gelatoporia subvermispora B]